MSRYVPADSPRTVSTEGIGTFAILATAIASLIALNRRTAKLYSVKAEAPYVRIGRNLDILLTKLKNEDVTIADKVTVNMSMLGEGKKSPINTLKEIKTLASTLINKGSALVNQINTVQDDSSIDSDTTIERSDELVGKLSLALKAYDGVNLNGYELYAKQGQVESNYDRPSVKELTVNTMTAKDIVALLQLAVELRNMLPTIWAKLPMNSNYDDATGFGLNFTNMVIDTLDDVIPYIKRSLV